MRIIQSFWSLPAFSRHDAFGQASFTGGWLHPRYYLMSWAFSCLQLRSFYNDVRLVTDRVGKKLLIDQLQLPYTRVTLELENLHEYDPGLWAIGKLYTFGLQQQPFIHVDGDVFIWERFPQRIEQAGLIAQNIEHEFPFYRELLQTLADANAYLPAAIKNNYLQGTCINAYNAGIIGGRNLAFFSHYVSEALRFVRKTDTSHAGFSTSLFNTIYEQHLYYCLAKKLGLDVQCYLDVIDEAELNFTLKGITQFRNAPASTGYIHLFGEDAKKDPGICEELSAKLKFHYPQYHKRILQVVEQIEETTLKITHDVQRSGSVAI
jgi:hypothetical protein